MRSVVVCKVSQPSRKKRKSYVENFVIAKCACFNDEVTLTQHVICMRTFLVFLTRMMIWWVIPVCPFSAVPNEIPKKDLIFVAMLFLIISPAA